MPGATTARFVVRAFEIPIKLLVVPQTVPNRSTNGGGRADYRENAGAAGHCPGGSRLDPFKARGGPFLYPLGRSSFGIADHHLRTLRYQQAGLRSTLAARPAAHEHHLVVEACHVRSPDYQEGKFDRSDGLVVILKERRAR